MLLAALILAVQQVAVSGVVRDSLRSEPVSFAQVTIRDAAGHVVRTVSDELGVFIGSGLRSGPLELSVHAVGYSPWSDTIAPERLRGIEVRLQPLPLNLQAIDVVGARAAGPLSLAAPGFRVDSALIAALPKVLETDVFRAATIAPSVSANSDFNAMPFVRGGTSDGTPVLLDGIRLFNPFHLLGFLSAFNAEAVDHVTMLTSSGGAALRHGATSGALEVATRDGARDRIHSAGAIGLASGRASVEGPIDRSTSFLLDARRTYIDAFTGLLDRIGAIDRQVPYAFSDLHGKITRTLDGIDRISVTGYRSAESLGDIDGSDTSVLRSDWSNAALGVHYRAGLGANGLLDMTLGRSGFSSRFRVQDGDLTELDAAGEMHESRLDARASWHIAPMAVLVGVEADRFGSDYALTVVDPDLLDIVPNLRMAGSRTRLAGYSQVGLALGSDLEIGGGLRIDHFARLGLTASPSLNLALRSGGWSIGLDAAQSYQALFSLRNEESVYASFIAYDLLTPVEAPPLVRSREIAVAAEGSLRSVGLRIAAYTRSMAGLRLLPLGRAPIDGPVLVASDSQQVGRGAGKGLELSAQWRRGTFDAVASYRWSLDSRTVNGETYTPRFHRDHELDAAFSLHFGESSLSARLSARSGQPYTPLLALVPVVPPVGPDGGDAGARGVVALGGRYNAGRLPGYVRLDLGWQAEKRTSIFGVRGTVVPYAALLNALNSHNVLAAEVDEAAGRPALRYLPQLPILPFFGLEFRF
ncbi:MAG: TonB-dependent receptor [Gemmatimonadetes bacterium]|nr:TonB-dependent receptor [Gemmatimonadota bacterium]